MYDRIKLHWWLMMNHNSVGNSIAIGKGRSVRSILLTKMKSWKNSRSFVYILPIYLRSTNHFDNFFFVLSGINNRSCIPHPNSAPGWHNSQVRDLGHCRSRTLPLLSSYVLPRCASCHRRLRHYQRRHFYPGQNLGAWTTKASPTWHCDRLGRQQIRLGVKTNSGIRGGQRLCRREWSSVYGDIGQKCQQRQWDFLGHRAKTAARCRSGK